MKRSVYLVLLLCSHLLINSFAQDELDSEKGVDEEVGDQATKGRKLHATETYGIPNQLSTAIESELGTRKLLQTGCGVDRACINIANTCKAPIRVFIRFRRLDNLWVTRGPFILPPNTIVRLAAQTRNRYVYFHVQAPVTLIGVTNSGIVALADGVLTQFHEVNIGDRAVTFTQIYSCD